MTFLRNSRTLYNENDPFACAWLSNLMDADLITPGKIDDRSIEDLTAEDVAGFERVHFFAGIAGWEEALALARWPEGRPVWTGSCPCQPLSSAGQRKGHVDKRHLWPAFYRLINLGRPPTVFGEQVADTLGREWLAGVRADLESSRYAVGAADLCAAGVKAPHKRQRLYWLADAAQQPEREQKYGPCAEPWQDSWHESCGNGILTDRMDNPAASRCDSTRPGPEAEARDKTRMRESERGRDGGVAQGNTAGGRRPVRGDALDEGSGRYPLRAGDIDRLGQPSRTGLSDTQRDLLQRARRWEEGRATSQSGGTPIPEWNGPTRIVECKDGFRRISAESWAFPLAARVSGRVAVMCPDEQAETAHQANAAGSLSGSGNAIVPQVAAVFISAFLDISGGCRP